MNESLKGLERHEGHGWVINDITFIFGWAIPLKKMYYAHCVQSGCHTKHQLTVKFRNHSVHHIAKPWHCGLSFARSENVSSSFTNTFGQTLFGFVRVNWLHSSHISVLTKCLLAFYSLLFLVSLCFHFFLVLSFCFQYELFNSVTLVLFRV